MHSWKNYELTLKILSYHTGREQISSGFTDSKRHELCFFPAPFSSEHFFSDSDCTHKKTCVESGGKCVTSLRCHFVLIVKALCRCLDFSVFNALISEDNTVLNM